MFTALLAPVGVILLLAAVYAILPGVRFNSGRTIADAVLRMRAVDMSPATWPDSTWDRLARAARAP